MAKKKKAKRKIKQPTKAEIEAQIKHHEEELQEEAELLENLNKIEFHTRAAVETGATDNLARNLLTLIRAYKRKHLEAAELRSHLVGIKDFLTECWDEEEQYFDPSYARDHDHYVPGHWCPNMIEEIGEMTEEGTVYSALPVGSVF